MATVAGPEGSIHRGTVEQRRQQLTVTGCPAGPVRLTWGRVELGGGTMGQPFKVYLSVLPLGTQQITARWSGGSDTKTTTVIPDPKPGPTNTGHRSPLDALALWTGPGTLSPGVYEGFHFDRPMVFGRGVTVLDSLVRPSTAGSGGRAVSALDGALLEDVTIDGAAGVIGIGIGYATWTGRRLDIRNCSDGVRASSGAHLVDSWVHHLKRSSPAAHADCVQTTGGTGALIEHCTLEAWNPDRADYCNAAVMIGGETAPLVDFTVRDCWVDGGTYSVNVRSDAGTSVTLENLRYGPNAKYGELVYGTAVPTFSGVTAEGTAVTAKRH